MIRMNEKDASGFPTVKNQQKAWKILPKKSLRFKIKDITV